VLFTDFGLQGPYTGQMKAVLHRMAPGIPVIDLFADAPIGNPKASAYLLAAYAVWFAAGTVFVCIVDAVRAGDSECAEVMRDLVETVTIFRDSSKLGGVEVEIVGRLTALLGEKAYPTGVRGVWGKMVAEERIRRNHPFLQIEV
jgi:SAM hydroxide adenosyltransferase N-terminal domain